MRTLGQVLSHQGPAGAVLPDILPTLSSRGIRLRRGQVTMVIAQSNGGKSMFALWYAVTSGVRCLYVSADTDPHTTLLRAAAITMQITTDEVEAMIAKDKDKVREELAGLSRIRFAFDPSPTMQDIDLEVAAYEEVFGAFPELIVIDSLYNVMSGSENEWQGMRETVSDMHILARNTEACCVILHHVSENDSKVFYPAPKRAIMGKVSQLPEMILSLAIEPESSILRVACVKNRHDTHDPTGETYETCYVDAPRMTLYPTMQELQMSATRRQWS